MPFESSSLSHPTTIARGLMCVAVCLQQLPKDFDFSRLGSLSHSVDDLAASLTETVCASVTSDDEIVATAEGIECLILQTIFFVNAGKPRRAWLGNRRALAIAQVLGLHVHRDESFTGGFESLENQPIGPWRHIVHSDRYLALTLGLPYGSMETDEPSASRMMSELEERQQDILYLKELDRIAARIIDRGQFSTSSAFVATQSIGNTLESLAQSMPPAWWQHMGQVHNMDAEALGRLYHRLNVQLWHHQLSLVLHLPFMLDSATQRKYEYSRFSCSNAARGLIKTYLFVRTTFGMFSCCLTNFQAFTASVILIFNLFMPNPTFETEHVVGQKEADLALIQDVINTLDQSNERFHDFVAVQASNVLRTLRKFMEDPENQGGGNFNFTIPYFGTISIARRTSIPGIDMVPSTGRPSDYSSTFMANIDMSQPILPDPDELLQQWLIDDSNWPS
ncbi:Fc.00g046180.m01.CDS01 [Cosmosporella sp. VM-42]